MKHNPPRLAFLPASIATRTAAHVFSRLRRLASPLTMTANAPTACKIVTESGATGYIDQTVPIEVLPAWKEKIRRAEQVNRETLRQLLADDEQRDINTKPV